MFFSFLFLFKSHRISFLNHHIDRDLKCVFFSFFFRLKDDKDRSHRDHHRSHRDERHIKSGTSEERKSKDRRHRSGSRDKTNNSRRAENSSQSKNSDKKPLNTESIADKTNAAALSVNEQEGSLNIADMLKTIHVPPEIRFKPAEAAKYQMDQLRLKVCTCYFS